MWLVAPPLSVAKARTVRGGKSAVSEGSRSFASTITGSVIFSNGLEGCPNSEASNRSLDVDELFGAAVGFHRALFADPLPGCFQTLHEVANHATNGVFRGVIFRTDGASICRRRKSPSMRDCCVE